MMLQIRLRLTADFQWDATNKRIKNVATPTADTDAVNKSFISTAIPNITTVAGISGTKQSLVLPLMSLQ